LTDHSFAETRPVGPRGSNPTALGEADLHAFLVRPTSIPREVRSNWHLYVRGAPDESPGQLGAAARGALPADVGRGGFGTAVRRAA
jgi:hypothetical protein